jgi:hypothetical protein
MPNWRKVLVSGSDASLNTLNVANGITGSLFGTASYAVTASYVNPLHQIVQITSSTTAASLLGSGSGLFTVDGTHGRIFTIDDTISGSLFSVVTGSTPILEVFSSELVIISGSLDVSSGITGSLFGTASWAISSSYALTASYVSGSSNSVSASYALSASYAVSASYASTASYAFAFPDQGFGYTQSPGSTTWTIVHGLNTRIPLVDVYDSSYNQLIPAGVVSIDPNTIQITFSTAQAGYAIISKGSGINSDLAVSASYALSASYATTASYALTSPASTLQEVVNAGNGISNYGGNGSASIQLTNFTNDRTLYLNDNSYPTIRLVDNLNASNNLQIDIATLSLNGISYNWSDIVSNTSSYALTASYVQNAVSASYVSNAVSASYVQNAVSASYVENAQTASYVLNAISSSYALSASYAVTASYSNNSTTASYANNSTSASYADSSISASYAITSSYSNNSTSASYANNATTSSYSNNSTSASYAVSSSYALTASYLSGYVSPFPYTGSAVISGSLVVIGPSTITGSLLVSGSTTQLGNNTLTGNTVLSGSINISGSSTINGLTSMTGSLAITGSTIQVGNNTLLGNTVLSGSVTISGSSLNPQYTSLDIYGNTDMTGYLRFLSQSIDIDTAVSGAYIYMSGSTQDLYFSQNSKGYANTIRLRWLEGNLYTGLLGGGIITSQSSTVYQVSSGSGIIVSLNASLNDNPYPTVQYLNWGNLSQSIAPLSASYDQAFVAIQSNGTIYQQGTPITAVQNNSVISIGNVLFQNHTSINGVKTSPYVAYGLPQRQDIFTTAFGPLKLSGYTLAPSGSSTGSLVVGSGTAYADGANYPIDPNNPSYVTDNGTNVSKIFRYYDSGSGTNNWVYDTNNGAGYATIDPTNYSNNGVLTAVPGTGANRRWSIQRAFWYPNSVTKAIVVYYGNATYPTEVEATANIPYEPFVEAPNTAANAIYLGSIVVRNDANFTDSTSFKIQPGGLFRQVGGSGGGGSVVTQTLTGLSDVAISGPTNLEPFVYSTTAAKWINSSIISASVVGNATTATSASYAVSASQAGGALFAESASNAIHAETIFPYTGIASITGSLDVTNAIALGDTLSTYNIIGSSAAGGNNLFNQVTGSYTSAFFKYTVSNGANARAGELMAVWNGSTTNYTDVSTTDIGNTSAVTCSAAIAGSNIQFNITTGTSGWKIKSLATYM